MVDKEELAKKLDDGELTIDDTMDFFTVLAEIANESEDIQDEIDGWDRVLVFNIEGVKKITLKVQDGKVEVSEGAADESDITLTMNADTAVGVLSGEVDATSAYMAGDLKVEGPLPDAIKFRTIIELLREELEDYA